MPEEPFDEVHEAGLRLLARREHSSKELRLKLMKRGYEAALIERALEALRAENALNDARFAEEFIRARRRQGYGPVRIRAELNERGVESALAEPYLEEGDEAWDELAAEQWRKRFGSPPRNMNERAKQYRFLSNRGFTAEQIRRAIEARG